MDLAGKTVVVTGGTSGIGRATAQLLAARGADVIVIGRDAAKGAEVEAALRAARGHGTFIQADLSLVAEARRVVGLLADLPRLDALILSAGVIDFSASTTSEGIDRGFVINFLHKLVLAEGLRPALARASGRMVLVATKVPWILRLDWANFEGARRYVGLRGVARLHLASLALMQAYAAEWRADGITVTAIHPGQIDTAIYRDFSRWPWRQLKRLMRVFLVTIDKPAALLGWLAFSTDAQLFTGEFFPSVKNFAKHNALALDPQTVNRVRATAQAVIANVAA